MPTKKNTAIKPELDINKHINAKQREYNIHASKIKAMRSEGLDKLLESKRLDGAQVKQLLLFLRHRLSYDMLASIEENLKYQLKDTDSIHINVGSLIRYLTVLPCDKVRASPISFDDDTGKIGIWYNSDRSDHDSVKITLIANEHDFTFSVLSRRDSLATMSGTLKLHADANYKIEAFMDTTLSVAVAVDTYDDLDAGM